jgi:hypothetical protein
MQVACWYNSADAWSAIGACVGGASTFAAFVGLVFYTIYTRRMMISSEAILRATIEPILNFERFRDSNSSVVYFDISNAGNGPALNAVFYITNDSSTVSRFGEIVKWGKADLGTSMGLISAHTDSKSRPNFNRPASGTVWLLVVEASDSAGGTHQLQIRFELNDADQETTTFRRVSRRVRDGRQVKDT